MYRKQKRYSFPQTLDPTTHSIKGVHTFIALYKIHQNHKTKQKANNIPPQSSTLSLYNVPLQNISSVLTHSASVLNRQIFIGPSISYIRSRKYQFQQWFPFISRRCLMFRSRVSRFRQVRIAGSILHILFIRSVQSRRLQFEIMVQLFCQIDKARAEQAQTANNLPFIRNVLEIEPLIQKCKHQIEVLHPRHFGGVAQLVPDHVAHQRRKRETS